jgi:hypothetical protein
MSDYETPNWIETTIEVHYKDGSTRLIKVKPGENLADAAGEGWTSLSIVESPYGAYSHDNITPKGGINPRVGSIPPLTSPKGEEIDEAETREGAFDPG